MRTWRQHRVQLVLIEPCLAFPADNAQIHHLTLNNKYYGVLYPTGL